MRIGIIGGGSIGLLLGGFLGTNHEVTMYVRRSAQFEALHSTGIHIMDQYTTPVRVSFIHQLQKEDVIIVCVKQPHINVVLHTIRTSNHHIPLLFLQNGMGHLQFLEHLSNPLYVGVVEHGAVRMSDTTVFHTGKGKLRVAPYKGDMAQLRTLVKKLHSPNFPIDFSLDWKELLTYKLIINAVINPLTAIFDVKNKAVIENPSIRFLAKALCKEACSVFSLNESDQWKRIETIAKRTGNNTSSMLEDIKQNRKTENEAISLYLLNNSQEELPYTNFVYYSVLALEEKKGIIYGGY